MTDTALLDERATELRLWERSRWARVPYNYNPVSKPVNVDDESESWEELDATAISPQRLRQIADYVRSTGQASA